MWHQLWSSSTVSTTISASSPAGEWALAVSTPVRAPAAADAARARFVAAVPPFVGHADHEPAARRVEGELERLRRHHGAGAAAHPGRPDRLAEDLDGRLGRVLAGAAAGDDDRRAGARRLPDGSREPPGAALGIREAVQDPAGHARLRRDHLGHVVRRAVPA